MMMHNLMGLLGGILFGAGLTVSGMTNPAKVVGFLDVFGTWDASLMFVMASAVVLGTVGTWFIRRRNRPWFGDRLDLPTNRLIDRKLILGSAMFGAGWGLGGFCPGPALTAAGGGNLHALLFVVSMTAGMMLHRWALQPRITRPSEVHEPGSEPTDGLAADA